MGAGGVGFTVFGGAGYEFARHWSVEVDYVHMFDPDPTVDHDHDIGTLMVTIGGLAY
jgi:opacity protein-like surface antigen